ncbi:hypothetical protein ACFXMT_15200 [Streptomyces mirabilis]|uniref:hypothetical protein n=1 Tax=Streptomyces mirabilis TaxID=68239 RepID=UPI00369E0088
MKGLRTSRSNHVLAWSARTAVPPRLPQLGSPGRGGITRLRAREVELATTIVTHTYWSSFAPADVLAARDALKHHHEQQTADASS